MAGGADLVQRIDQGVIVMGLERNVEVNRGAGERGTKVLPVVWDGLPGVHHTHIIPRLC